MSLNHEILIALLLDLIFGYPFHIHPVNLIAKAANFYEEITLKNIRNKRLAGVITASAVLLTVIFVSFSLLKFGVYCGNFLAVLASVFILYSCMAVKSLKDHAKEVYAALHENDITKARKKVALIVGRDTENLNKEAVCRACIESVAENIVDGITAPLFYAFIFGPIGAITYKAINTMDSMFGYKNEKYYYFGWAAARVDDIANYLPARITALLIPLAAFVMRLNYKNSFKILLRDGKKHPSPNAGLTEAAAAGALGILLGGDSTYNNKISKKPLIGLNEKAANEKDILRVINLMYVTTFITCFFYFCGKLFLRTP